MALVGDVYQVIHFTEYLSDLHQNVYWYRVDVANDTAPMAGNIQFAFNNIVPPTLWPLLSTQVFHRGYTVVNWRDPSDFLELPYSANDINGDLTGEPLPDILRWHFQLVKDRPGRTPGHKYIVGLAENAVVGNDAAAAFLTPLQNYGQVVDNTLLIANGTITPVIPIRYRNNVKIMPNLGAGNPETWHFVDCVFEGITGRHFKGQG